MTITVEELHRIFEADYEAGIIRWKVPPQSAIKVGTEAGGKHIAGYRHISLKGKKILTHRILWAMKTGAFPAADIDHINGIRDDNRICNLRAVTRAENMKNQTLSRANKTGHLGIQYLPKNDKWTAQITINGEVKHLGSFTDIQDAIAARQSANIQYGFHENHGRRVGQ